jgi:hypothetical protein
MTAHPASRSLYSRKIVLAVVGVEPSTGMPAEVSSSTAASLATLAARSAMHVVLWQSSSNHHLFKRGLAINCMRNDKSACIQ